MSPQRKARFVSGTSEWVGGTSAATGRAWETRIVSGDQARPEHHLHPARYWTEQRVN